MAKSVKIVSYNVLSSHLGGEDYFTSCDPKYLNPSYRLKKLKEILDHRVKEFSIICLQEVSTLWLGDLHVFFAERGYHVISGMYGKKFNGYMGVVTAIPLSQYKILNVDIKTVSDTKNRRPKDAVVTPNVFQRTLTNMTNMYNAIKKSYYDMTVWSVKSMFFFIIPQFLVFYSWVSFFKSFMTEIVPLFKSEEKEEDAWTTALSRNNQIVIVRLQMSNGKRFVVGNYHMPCIFQKPQVMMIHTALSVQYLQKYAGEDALIYCGDFNMKPDSPMYKLVTTTEIDAEDPSTPVPQYEGDIWQCKASSPMRSAYDVSGGEPEFTNFSKVKDEPEFVGTLDYIFLSRQWEVLSVQELESFDAMKRITGGSPLPHRNHPSDHLLIAATLTIP